jgi:hypothetical protein
MTLADLLAAYEGGWVTRVAAMRWLACRRYADFLRVLDFTDRQLPRGRKPHRPLRQQIIRMRNARRRSTGGASTEGKRPCSRTNVVFYTYGHQSRVRSDCHRIPEREQPL